MLKSAILVYFSFFGTFATADTQTTEKRTHLNFAGYTKPTNVHPWYSTNSWTSNLAVNIFEGLTMDGPDGKAIPALAQSWVLSEDRSKITFKMRPNIKWSDGTPITAKDFYNNYLAYLKEPSFKPGIFHDLIVGGRDYRFGKIQEDEVGLSYDETSITFSISSHASFFPDILAHNIFALVPFHALESTTQSIDVTDLPYLPVTGAYAVLAADENHVELATNPSYYDYGKAALKTINYSWTEQPEQTLYHQIKSGDIDFAFVRPTFQTEFLKENFEEFLFPTQGHSMDYYTFNTTMEPFNDKEVRQALVMAIDRDRLNSSFESDELSGSNVFVPKVFLNDMKIEEPDWMKLSQEDQIERAKQTLAAHGYTKENPLKFTLKFNTSELHNRVAVAVSAMWSHLDMVEVELINLSLREHYENLRPESAKIPRYEVARAGWTADLPDAADFLSLLMSGNRYNYSRWSNGEYDETVSKIFIEESFEKRTELASKAMNMLLEEAPIIPMFSRADIILKAPNLVVPSIEGDRAYEFKWFTYE